MRKVSFYSERAAVAVRKPHRMISITEDNHQAEFAVEHKDLLRLSFHDVEGYIGPGVVQFSASDAEKILDFVSRVEDGEVLIVHCQAGISRSAAVAKFVIDKLGFALQKDQFCNGKMDLYNGRVYGMLRVAHMERTLRG